jgi:hypothetical protein
MSQYLRPPGWANLVVVSVAAKTFDLTTAAQPHGAALPRPPSARISHQRPLEVELDRSFWSGAADDRVAFGRRVQWFRRVGELTIDQTTLAVVANA